MSDFDYDANPAINAATIHTLARCEWIRKGEPLCLIGDSLSRNGLSVHRRDYCRPRLTDDFILAIHFSGLRWFGKLSSNRYAIPDAMASRRCLTC